ncbi:hypothetical protein MTsPCn5_00200 [Croceitalea sp. MTPC5]|uniref:fibronectin type III domain-containing protein n=1 Tax=Croceitalea sp. MTPC5 TaxID=3056565 RepID=UPI002B3DB56A|nr:hypothetical protein MTsPCn5_00200 [Croceitalea sp. MTPC5]
MKRPSLLFIILVLFFIQIATVFGQSFPVQIVPQAIPPTPVYFSSYANETAINGPLRVQITLNDLTIQNRGIRLRASFEGNGISFQSNEIVNGAAPLFLEGGLPLVLNNIDLAPYFRFENITGISPNVYGQPIPEGTYQFCFEVFDVLTGNRLSNRSCVNTVVFQNDPPILVSPQNRTIVEQVNPQNIVFQWTPRHINVSNVEYELSIVEIWDNQVDHQAAFLSSPPFFTMVTTATTYVYGPSDPLLLPDKNYAWRVQVRAVQGAEEIGVFNNQGFSEIYVFGSTTRCELPSTVTDEVKGATNANILWTDFSQDPAEYSIRYRQKDSGGEWFYSKTTAEMITLWDLKPGTEYEYQLSKKCVLSESEYSRIQTFRTNLFDDDDSAYECGIAPNIDVSNQVPLESLEVDEKFTAGDFPVTVLEVNGGNGYFNGKGYVTIPYLKSIKVAVEFTNIFINQNKELAQGNVVTVYDPNLGGIIDPWDFVDDVGDIFNGGDHTPLDPVDFDIDTVEIRDGEIVVSGTDENGNPVEETFPYDEGDTYTITGNNTVYSIDENGNVNELGPTAEGGSANSANTVGVQEGGDGTVNSPSVISIDDSKVTFSYSKDSASDYGWDIVDNSYEENNYPGVSLENGGTFYPVHKAVKNGTSDSFYVDVNFKDATLSLEQLVFKTIGGLALETETVSGNSNRVKVTVKGNGGYRNEEAIITLKDGEDKQVVVSSFFIHHLRPLAQANITLVPVNGAAIQGIKAQVAQKFNEGGGQLNVIDGSTYTGNTSELRYTESGLLTRHPQSFIDFYQDFKANSGQYNNNSYYVFVFDDDVQPGNIAGFMPRNSQFGFVFPINLNTTKQESKRTVADLVAHEVGHGVFALSHPFEQGSSGLGTNWLMDYGDGNELAIRDWEAMGFDGLRINVFDDDGEGALTNSSLKIWQVLNHIQSAYSNERTPLAWKNLVNKKCTHERHFYPIDCRLTKSYSLTSDSGVDLKFRLIKQPRSGIENFQIEPGSESLSIKESRTVSNLLGLGPVYDIYYHLKLEDSSGNEFVFEFGHHDDIETFAKYLGIGANHLNAEGFTVEVEDLSEQDVRELYEIPEGQSIGDFFRENPGPAPSNTIVVIGQRQTNISKQIIRWLDANLLPTTIDDETHCNDIDVYFAEVPSFHAQELSDQQLWAALGSLLICNVDETFTNEERAVLTIIESLGKKSATSLLDGLLEKKAKGKTLLRRLFEKLDDVGEGEKFTDMVTLLTKYWKRSTHYNIKEYHALPYESNKFLGFYFSKYSIYFDEDFRNVTVLEKEAGQGTNPYTGRPYVESYEEVGTYYSYSTILLLNYRTIASAIEIKEAIIPMFLLKVLSTKNATKNWQQSGILAFDIAVTFTGIGNLAKLRHLRHVTRLQGLKITLGATEVTAGTFSLILKYSGCETDVCKKLNTFLVFVELASLSGDIALSQALKRSADEALQAIENAPNAIPDSDKNEIVTNLRRFTDGANDLSKYPFLDKLPNAAKTKVSNWPDETLALLNDDLADSQLLQAFLDGPDFIDAWQVLQSTSFRTEVRWLESYNTLKKNDLLKYVDELSEIEATAIHRYTVNNFELTSGAYQGTLTEQQLEWINLINSGLDKMRLTRVYQGSVFRGSNRPESEIIERYVNVYNEGVARGITPRINEPPFLSTSTSVDVAEDFIQKFKDPDRVEVLFEITSKRGVDIDDISDYGKNLCGKNLKCDRIQEEVMLSNNQDYEILDVVKTTQNDGSIRYIIKLSE